MHINDATNANDFGLWKSMFNSMKIEPGWKEKYDIWFKDTKFGTSDQYIENIENDSLTIEPDQLATY
jgi:hypothetical protein